MPKWNACYESIRQTEYDDTEMPCTLNSVYSDLQDSKEWPVGTY